MLRVTATGYAGPLFGTSILTMVPNSILSQDTFVQAAEPQGFPKTWQTPTWSTDTHDCAALSHLHHRDGIDGFK